MRNFFQEKLLGLKYQISFKLQGWFKMQINKDRKTVSGCLNPDWHEGWYFYLVIFGSDFVSWIFIKNFQTFLEVKIDINQ